MNKLMSGFLATTKKKKKKKEIADPNLDTACPAGIPCNKVHLMAFHGMLNVASFIRIDASEIFKTI